MWVKWRANVCFKALVLIESNLVQNLNAKRPICNKIADHLKVSFNQYVILKNANVYAFHRCFFTLHPPAIFNGCYYLLSKSVKVVRIGCRSLKKSAPAAFKPCNNFYLRFGQVTLQLSCLINNRRNKVKQMYDSS